MNFLMCQNMFLTQNLPSNTLSYDTKKIEEVRLFIFNQMQKTRDVLVLYMCSCLQNVDNKAWHCCRYMYSHIIFHCIAWWGATDTIAPINVLESCWLLVISFPKDINRVESGTAFWSALLFSFCTSRCRDYVVQSSRYFITVGGHFVVSFSLENLDHFSFLPLKCLPELS